MQSGGIESQRTGLEFASCECNKDHSKLIQSIAGPIPWLALPFHGVSVGA